MIQPIRQNISFQSANQGTHKTPEIYQSIAGNAHQTQPAPNVVAQAQNEVQPQKNNGGFFHGIKRGFMRIAKGFNSVKNTTSGFVKGLKEGLVAGTLVGTVGANLIKAKKSVSDSMKAKGLEASSFPLARLTFKTITGTVSDVAGTAWKFIKHIPDLYNKAPKTNIKTIIGLPGKFIKYMGNKKLIALSSAIAVGAVVLRTLQGKISANRANADIDHSLNEGHVH